MEQMIKTFLTVSYISEFENAFITGRPGLTVKTKQEISSKKLSKMGAHLNITGWQWSIKGANKSVW